LGASLVATGRDPPAGACLALSIDDAIAVIAAVKNCRLLSVTDFSFGKCPLILID
jgi:hypothetical protein